MQHRNELKQMIKYQAYLDTENIDDKLADKLATLYSDVQGKLSKKAKPSIMGLTKPTGTVSTQMVDLIPKKLKTDLQKEKYKQLVESGWEVNEKSLNRQKDVNTFLNNEMEKARRRGIM